MPPLVQLNFRCYHCQRQHRLRQAADGPRFENQPEIAAPPVHLQLRQAERLSTLGHRFGTEVSAYQASLRWIERRVRYADRVLRIVLDGLLSSLLARPLFVGGEKRWGQINTFHAFPGYVLSLNSSNTTVFCGTLPCLAKHFGACVLRTRGNTFRRVIWYY